MPVTLNELMKIPVMGQSRIRTSANTLSLRPVEFVSVMEIPVENFVRKNELVISTAMGCDNDPKIFREFVLDLIRSGAAGLVIATGRHIKRIPDEILRVADEQEFPIIEIPWEVRFADVTEAVLTELHNWHLTNMKKNEELQNMLLKLFLHGSDLSDALNVISKELDNAVIIIDNEGRIKGKSRNSEAFLHLMKPYLQRIFSESEVQRAAPSFDVQLDSVVMYTIQSADKIFGHLFLNLMPQETRSAHFTSEKDNIVRHSLSVILLWFQKEQDIRDTELRLRDDFVWSLAKGDDDSWENISSRAESLGYNLWLPYVCIIGLIGDMEKSYNSYNTLEPDYDQWMYKNINSVKEQILLTGKNLKLKTMVTWQQNRLVIFLEVSNNQVRQIADKFLDVAEIKLKRLMPHIVMTWGIGENRAGVKTFSQSFKDANTALDICYQQEGPGHRSTYSKTSINRIIRMMADDPELQEIVQLIIGELAEYDNKHGLALLNTLKIYIQNQGNVSETARALNLHRQSLLYRLKKIESITYRSLDNADDLFLLNLSLRLWLYSEK